MNKIKTLFEKKNPLGTALGILLSLIFWCTIWYLASIIYAKPLLLPAPTTVFPRVFKLIFSARFWAYMLRTSFTLLLGYIAGSVLGLLLGIFTAKSRLLDLLFTPIFSILRATPVACFIIIAWVFLGSAKLPAVIAALMVAPVMMTNVATGVRSAQKELLEASSVLRLSLWDKIRVVYFPALLPHLTSGLVISAGLAWKSGIAAEVIALSADTLGFAVYEAKSWTMDVVELFALTILIAIFALLGESLLSFALKLLARRKERRRANH